jgi:hypothetical protein
LAITCLYLAVKLHGDVALDNDQRGKVCIGAFVELSRGAFHQNRIEETEKDVLHTLAWNVNPPTHASFVDCLLRLLPKWQNDNYQTTLASIRDVARYLTELAECVSFFSFSCKTSVTAFAAILCAIEVNSLPHSVHETFLLSVTQATRMNATDPQVCRTCAKLKECYPALFTESHLERRIEKRSAHTMVLCTKTQKRRALSEGSI